MPHFAFQYALRRAVVGHERSGVAARVKRLTYACGGEEDMLAPPFGKLGLA
jgi:hypothetical protein